MIISQAEKIRETRAASDKPKSIKRYTFFNIIFESSNNAEEFMTDTFQFFIFHFFAGDRIMSLTIDFRHIVQEDAMTILSYASPYNVQLELVNGNNKLRSSGSSKNRCETSSPKPGRQSPLVHPLVRSSSQSDLNTV